ncbi:HSP70-HSP90 organizing protein 3-like protein, partial [Tanacetum coccineum]
YDECIKDCEKAVERGRELCSDYKMVATALTIKGTVLVKMAKVSKDFEPAIATFQKTLTEHRNPDTLKNLNDAERAMKELEQQVYYDPKLAEKEREKVNEYFKEQKYLDAIKHYQEALRRNPKDAKVLLLANRNNFFLNLESRSGANFTSSLQFSLMWG